MPTANPRQRRSRNREATEQALLDACGSLLLQDGPEGIGVNAVVSEAGVGKDLIYRYFGGLPGLIKAWLEKDANWPTVEELTLWPDGEFASLERTEQIKTICRNYLKAMRNRPVIIRLLVSEMMQPSDVSMILEDAGDRIGKELYQSLRLSEEDTQSEDIVDVALVFTIVTNYLCMRALTSPNAYSMDLRDEQSWARIERVLETVVERYLNHD